MTQLVTWCSDAGIVIAGIIKGTSGMETMALDYEACGAKWIGSSRLEQLKHAKDAGVKVPLMMIRIPMMSELEELVDICEYSLQSERATIDRIDEILESNRTHGATTHKVILMVDLGDLREGVFAPDCSVVDGKTIQNGYDFTELAELALHVEKDLDNVELAGIGTNLGCYGSVMPDKNNMHVLADAADAVEQAIGRRLDVISGGATSSLMPVFDHEMPVRSDGTPYINMLRIGAVSMTGPMEDIRVDYDRREIDVMRDDALTLLAEVIEVKTKSTYPIGRFGVNAFGERPAYVDRGIRTRALLAVGRADYGECADIIPQLEGAEVIGASGDHTILDIEECKTKPEVGDIIAFKLRYSAILRLTSSENVKRYDE